MQEVGSENNWTTPLISYLKTSMLLDGKDAARKLKVQASRFYADKICPIQKRILMAVPEVFKPRGSILHNERNP